MIVARHAPAHVAPVPDIASLVIVIDDDEGVREALGSLFRSVDLGVALFASTRAFLHASLPDVPACIVLDIRMPGGSGLELQAHLERTGSRIPIVFMTGHGDIAMSVRAMKAGAVDFLTKPFRDQDMLDVVIQGIEQDARRRQADAAFDAVRCLHAALTPREKQVMALVARGLLNKQIAGMMNLQEITVKIHRGNMMRKMKARSIAEIVRLAQAVGLDDEDRQIRIPV